MASRKRPLLNSVCRIKDLVQNMAMTVSVLSYSQTSSISFRSVSSGVVVLLLPKNKGQPEQAAQRNRDGPARAIPSVLQLATLCNFATLLGRVFTAMNTCPTQIHHIHTP
ncbi:hypothetical protein LMH87_007184 [Akanthomyces muscarius]|uniref:Uncharacterized protein n=1 Tax=Akanthomyces muscarius TaxID=2231603 RepID=A0A9W8QQB7_AKAMU|nr:hypothetical protein LMH87_007184 [Akanthomyces muscarius]KAJ4165555.1 hypothetical protein LMH87_007184 [Akanthomyces muscarius]